MRQLSFFGALTNIFILLAVLPRQVLADVQAPWRDRSQDDLMPPKPDSSFAYARLCNVFGATGKNCYVTEDCRFSENGATLCQVQPGDPEKLPQAVRSVVDEVNLLMEDSARELGYSSLEKLPQDTGDLLVQVYLSKVISVVSALFVDREIQDRLTDGVEREFSKGSIPADEHPFRLPADRFMAGVAVSKSPMNFEINGIFAEGATSHSAGAASSDGRAQMPVRPRRSSPRS